MKFPAEQAVQFDKRLLHVIRLTSIPRRAGPPLAWKSLRKRVARRRRESRLWSWYAWTTLMRSMFAGMPSRSMPWGPAEVTTDTRRGWGSSGCAKIFPASTGLSFMGCGSISWLRHVPRRLPAIALCDLSLTACWIRVLQTGLSFETPQKAGILAGPGIPGSARCKGGLSLLTPIERDLATGTLWPNHWNAMVASFGISAPVGDPGVAAGDLSRSISRTLAGRRFFLFLLLPHSHQEGPVIWRLRLSPASRPHTSI